MKKIRKKDLIINSIIIIILIVVLIIVILLKDNETKNNGEKTKETVFSPDKTVSSSKETIMYNLTINNINIVYDKNIGSTLEFMVENKTDKKIVINGIIAYVRDSSGKEIAAASSNDFFTFYPGTKSIYNSSFDKDITDYKDTIEFKIMYQE